MSSPPSLISLEDYDAIADAVMETERGRWFLAEFARRNRSADTEAVLDALAALERRLPSSAPERPAPLALPVPAKDEFASVKTLLPLIETAVEKVARIRAELSSASGSDQLVQRVRRECVELDDTLALALSALGDARAQPSLDWDAGGTSTPTRDTGIGWIDIDVLEAEIATTLDAPGSTDEAAALEHTGGEYPVADGLETYGEALQDSEEPASPTNGRAPGDDETSAPPFTADALLRPPAADHGHPAPRAPIPLRPPMPAAWTPGLLDALTPEERAILFA